MTISQVYQHYQVPPNVQDHMLTTGVVIDLVRNHWQGEHVDWPLTMKAVLLHDLGNLIKFKRPFLGDLEKDGDHWQQIQAEMISLYGNQASEATIKMVRDLNLGNISEKIAFTLEEMRKIKNLPEGETVPIESRLIEYADCVVTPLGIQSFEVRMSDLAKRYNRNDKSWDKGFRENAQVVQENVNFDVFGDLGEMVEKIDSVNIFEFRNMEV